MLKILVVGGYLPGSDKEKTDAIKTFGDCIGAEIIRQGHVLLNGCYSKFDRRVLEGAHKELLASDPQNVNARLKSYVRAGKDPIHEVGTLIQSVLSTWDPAEGVNTIPEPIAEADVVIFVGGHHGVNRAALWSELSHTPILPVATYEGASQKLYQREIGRFEEKYEGRIERDHFQNLSIIGDEPNQLAKEIVSLAERILVSKSVAVMMSYGIDETVYKNLVNSYRIVCQELGYEIEMVTELTAEEGIVIEIHKKIRHAAFILADFTDLKPNVFYEFGYAQGLGKPRIVTARKATELPFDVKDVPTLFWEDDWADLQDKLRDKIGTIAKAKGLEPD
jgi:hypothetical protein